MRPFVIAGLALVLAAAPTRADDYAVDPPHAAATFKVSHLGLSWTHGRFKDVSGTFTIDPANPAAAAFTLTAKVDSLDTDNAKRDEHLKSPDFFDAKKFEAITFKSTAVEAAKDGYRVTGDLTLHGVTKPVTFALAGGRTAEFPPGTKRVGFSTEFVVKRSEYGMDKMLPLVGDEVYVSWSFEGVPKK